MRLISQDGKWDVDYDQCNIYSTYGFKNYYINATLSGGVTIELAKYSTKEKAEKAMEMLHDKYLSRFELNGGYDNLHGCYVQPNFWVLPKVFQFPKDEDLEDQKENVYEELRE